ncbi:MAG: Re/Si-specific NAD(P)(+) transhydrogenase subunit alpha [Polyangiales bacterium]
MRVGVPKESADNERRVAATPESVKKLVGLGFEVAIESSAGIAAGITDEAYEREGATIVASRDELFRSADVLVKVRPPSLDEIPLMREGTLLVSLLQPERNAALVPALAAQKVDALALERIPRVTRAQKMDVLSSMANLAGYRAVLEAAAVYQGFFGKQVTAAGSAPPAKVLIIGAGVAGLAAIGAARALGAEVRAFDTRAAAREQVESMGATFLEVTIQESGDGGGGYAKVMSPEFIAAEMALFREQAKEVSVIVTTALVPGTKAPILVPKDVVDCLARGSIVVDLAAEQGGNCELTKPGEIVDYNGVKIIGFTDLTSRMASVASRFFANNIVHLLTDMGGGTKWKVDLDDEVIRPAIVVHKGEELPPPPRKEPSPAKPAATSSSAKTAEKKAESHPKSVAPPPEDAKPKQHGVTAPPQRAWVNNVFGMVVVAVLFLLGRFAPRDFLQHFTVFVLACFVGWQVIWSVSPSLHTPLMSVTNAISGIIVVGGMLQIGGDFGLATVLGAAAVLVATVNIAGGFLVTQRMLKMFTKDGGQR